MAILDINLENTFQIKQRPNNYADLINDPDVKAFIQLSSKLKSDAVKVTELEDNLLIGGADLSGGISKEFADKIHDINNRFKVRVLRVNESPILRSKAINMVIRVSWEAFFKGINMDYKYFHPKALMSIFVDFTEENVLERLKFIDELLSVEHTAQVYKNLKPFIHCEILDDGNVCIRSKPIKFNSNKSFVLTDSQLFAISNKKFNWLINFIFYNQKGSSFNFDTLGGDVPQKFNFNSVQFEKFGFALLRTDNENRFDLKISKEHLPFLEQQIDFKVADTSQRNSFKNMVSSLLNRK